MVVTSNSNMGIDINIDVDFDREELLRAVADQYEAQIERGEIDCPSEDCSSTAFDSELWISDSGGLEGAAICLECNERIDLDIDDSDVQNSLDDMESSVRDLENSF